MKNKDMLVFFIKMVLIFLVFDFCVRYLPGFFTQNILNFKYGKEFIAESIFALLILVMVISFKNTYIFTEKKEPFLKSVYLGLPMLIFSGISLLTVVTTKMEVNSSFINLILFCISVGIAEEFMCRGWIQNEFIERFSKNYKEVFVSILLSAFIFGAMHITNIFNGQTVFETLMQVVQATSLGFLLGSIYYRSKNIWAVIFLHAFYDFSFMLPEVNSLKDCTGNAVLSTSAQLETIYASILISIIFFVSGLIVLRKNKVMNLINKNDKTVYKDNKGKLLMIIFSAVFLMFMPIGDYSDIKTCYSYENEIKLDYETIYPHYNTFIVTNNNVKYSLKIENKNLVIKNENTNEKAVLFHDFSNDYNQYELLQDSNGFKILVLINGNDSKVYYKKYYENEIVNLNTIKNELKEYIVPDLKQIGYIKFSNKENKNVYMISELNDKFYINDEGQLKLIKDLK